MDLYWSFMPPLHSLLLSIYYKRDSNIGRLSTAGAKDAAATPAESETCRAAMHLATLPRNSDHGLASEGLSGR